MRVVGGAKASKRRRMVVVKSRQRACRVQSQAGRAKSAKGVPSNDQTSDGSPLLRNDLERSCCGR